MATVKLTARPEWQALSAHFEQQKSVHLRQLFQADPARAQRFSAEAAGILLDYSKHRVSEQTLSLLLALTGAVGLRGRIDAMFAGEKINTTEGRAVLHVALRTPRGKQIVVDGKDVVPEVHAVLDKMGAFAQRVR